MMRHSTLAVLAAALALPTAAQAAGSSTITPFAMTNASYAQNFDTLAITGTSRLLPAGFQIVEGGTGAAADGSYVAGNGSDNGGNIYSFGATGSAERALGSIGSGTVAPNLFGGVFTNGLGSAITALTFNYVGEQWRAGSATPDPLTFEYSTNATDLNSGTWTRIGALDFAALSTSAAGLALNGNDAANQRAIGATISGLSIANGASFGFRWTDMDSTGSDNGLAIDNLRITAALAGAVPAVPEPATWGMMLLGMGVLGFALRRRQTATVRFA